MRVRINDASSTDDLVRFLRREHCLAVKRAPRDVEVAPISALSKRADRMRLERLVDEWLGTRSGVRVELWAER